MTVRLKPHGHRFSREGVFCDDFSRKVIKTTALGRALTIFHEASRLDLRLIRQHVDLLDDLDEARGALLGVFGHHALDEVINAAL